MSTDAFVGLSADELRQRLGEAEDTLRAIRDGEADAVVMRGGGGDHVFALGGGDESYHAIMEAMDIGAAALDGRGGVLYANSALSELLGVDALRLKREGFRGVLAPAASELVNETIEKAVAGHHTAQFVQQLHGKLQHIVVTVAPLPLPFDQGSVVTFTDITERVEADRASESARIARAVISSANEAVVVCDRDGRVINANAAAAALAQGEPLGRWFVEAFPLSFPLSSPIIHTEDLVALTVEGNAFQGLEAQSQIGGREKDLLISAAPLRLTAREVGGCVVTLVDNSDRKAIEHQQSLLLRELDHRVKNVLAMVMSIASRTSANSTDLADFRARFNSRLHALAATHILLSEAAWNGVRLSAIVRRELAPYTSSAGPKLVLSGLDHDVSPDVGIAFGLVIHELTTNAVKYGALSDENGTITVSGELGDDGIVQVVWTERGGPLVTPPEVHGFGQTLIARSLDRGNGGGATVAFTPEGLTCEMRLPART